MQFLQKKMRFLQKKMREENVIFTEKKCDSYRSGWATPWSELLLL